MNFEEMKVIWDSQHREPLYAFNKDALHAIVRRRNADFNRRAAWSQFREIAIGLVFGALMLGCAGMFALGDPTWLVSLSWIHVPVSVWDARALTAAAVIWFYYAAYMFGARRRQGRREENFGTSLRGDLDRALDHVGFQIRIARSIVWWGFLPAWVATVLWIVVFLRLKGVHMWAYGVIAGVMAAAFYETRPVAAEA
jgi:hypothetical protein